MARKRFLKLEYMVTLVVIFGIILLVVPFDIETTVQANFISKWKEKLQRLEYMFDVIDVHEQDDILKSFKRADTPEKREALLINVIQPYFRINKGNVPRNYKQKFLNNSKISESNIYYFEDLYFAESGMVVGIKNLKDKPKEPKFIMMLDVNGLLPPNTWGKDVYGVEIYEKHLAPFGSNYTMENLMKDCSEEGTGVACSYYYNIGGGFND